MLELVSKLQTSSGRAALVDMYGAKHECADDAEMANDDDDVDANCCVPPAGTKVSLCKLAAHTVMNEQSGAIVGYSAEADRYVVQLEDGTRVRVCRGNLRLEALTTYDFAHAIGETCTAFSRLAARHGASMTSELVGALLQLPNREWTVMKDLVAVEYAWAARTQEGDSLHSLGAPRSHKAQKTNSTSYIRLQNRLHVLRATLPPKLAEEFLEVSAAAAPFRAAAVTKETAGCLPLRLAYNRPTDLVASAQGPLPLPYGHMFIPNCVDDSSPQPRPVACIPTEWPLQLAPWQFYLGKQYISSIYEV